MTTRWDAGDLGCGQLISELKARLDRLAPGAEFELTTHDAGAPADIPAWCRMTGHTLVSGKHPVYVIRRKP
jgi:tRNA 2-thiouridine synthesizing protein A